MRLTRISGKDSNLAVAGAVLLTTMLTASTAHAATYELPNFPGIIQLKSNWCWAAADYSILSYYGYYNATQVDIVNYTFNTTTAPNNTATLSQAQSALHHFGVSTNSYTGTLTYSAMQSQINSNKPILSSMNLTIGGGHAVVAYAYDTSKNSVNFMDPEDGGKYWFYYNEYIKNADHTWVGGLKDAWAYK